LENPNVEEQFLIEIEEAYKLRSLVEKVPIKDAQDIFIKHFGCNYQLAVKLILTSLKDNFDQFLEGELKENFFYDQF
jgi:hypothetical protein